MGNLIKAMMRSNKSDAFTQVDEAELYWDANDLYNFSNIP